MDIHQQAYEYLLGLPEVVEWEGLREFLNERAAREPRGWLLPMQGCQAVGGNAEEAVPAAAAIGSMQLSIILVDDMLDEDPRGKYNDMGNAQAANLTAAIEALGFQAIAQSRHSAEVKAEAHQILSRMMLTTAFGQQLDVDFRGEDEEGYWEVVRTKSCPFYGAGLQLGACFGGAERELSEQIRDFGELYGEIVQIHDDLRDTMATPAGPDWRQGRYTLPILFASLVPHGDRKRFLELRESITDSEVLQEAQTILVRCGAISYGVSELLDRCQTARQLLNQMELADATVLEELIENALHPLRALVKRLGGELPKVLQESRVAV